MAPEFNRTGLGSKSYLGSPERERWWRRHRLRSLTPGNPPLRLMTSVNMWLSNLEAEIEPKDPEVSEFWQGWGGGGEVPVHASDDQPKQERPAAGLGPSPGRPPTSPSALKGCRKHRTGSTEPRSSTGGSTEDQES
jgi:hypothetical protein